MAMDAATVRTGVRTLLLPTEDADLIRLDGVMVSERSVWGWGRLPTSPQTDRVDQELESCLSLSHIPRDTTQNWLPSPAAGLVPLRGGSPRLCSQLLRDTTVPSASVGALS